MQTEFTPRPEDQQMLLLYDSGAVKEEWYLRNGTPANGWSKKEYYENGKLKFAECYSNTLTVEQIFYNTDGDKTAHKIYSHAQKQLIDRPETTAAQKQSRPNVVSGTAHMGFFFKHMPVISAFIEADYDEAALDKAYYKFVNTPFPAAGEKLPTEDWDETIVPWRLQGKEMSFSIYFEHWEGYYHWSLHAKTEENYERANAFMDSIRE